MTSSSVVQKQTRVGRTDGDLGWITAQPFKDDLIQSHLTPCSTTTTWTRAVSCHRIWYRLVNKNKSGIEQRRYTMFGKRAQTIYIWIM
jgi:hypothetical protein